MNLLIIVHVFWKFEIFFTYTKQENRNALKISVVWLMRACESASKWMFAVLPLCINNVLLAWGMVYNFHFLWRCWLSFSIRCGFSEILFYFSKTIIFLCLIFGFRNNEAQNASSKSLPEDLSLQNWFCSWTHRGSHYTLNFQWAHSTEANGHHTHFHSFTNNKTSL